MAVKSVGAFLYVLGGEGGPCKIGWAEDVSRRSRYVPVPAGSTDILHKVPVAYRYALNAERYAHWLLRDHHFRNEWFSVEPSAAIDAVNKAAALNFKVVGRIPRLPELHNLPRLPKGTWALIDDVLAKDESRSDLIREAIERELKRRKA
ncbi:GIY-YIG nuclease family protein [Bradyrhizobium sp. 8-10B]|uniref:GIY-YIG nuclease family protein n=1 Tax=Bradyrhizobium sp. 8-10B TaxID=3344579 RepID=UPI0035C09272